MYLTHNIENASAFPIIGNASAFPIINTDDHLSMCSCSGGTELDKAVKFRISRSAWGTFSRGEQIRGYVHRENEHRGAHFRGWCTNSLANLCAGARLRGGNEYAVTPEIRKFTAK